MESVKWTRSVSLFLILCFIVLLLPVSAAGENAGQYPGMENFQKIRDYDGNFSDVPRDAWYYESVATVYELGLMEGVGGDRFSPGSSMTVAEAITLACRIYCIFANDRHKFVKRDPWYQAYVDYALAERWITPLQFDDYTAAVTRAEVAGIIGAMPSEMLAKRNAVQSGAIPGVQQQEGYGPQIYALYEAGIISGKDEKGTFHPDEPISRSEMAAIAARIALPEQRKSFELTAEYLTVYADNGEALQIPTWELEGRLSLGWRTEPFTIPADANAEAMLNAATLRPMRTNYEPLDRLIDEIFARIITEDMTTYQKTKACYDYLIENTQYGMDQSWDDENDGIIRYLWLSEPYGPDVRDGFYVWETLEMLETGWGVCDHYAAAFLVMTRRIGLESYACYGIVPWADGSGETGHVWNTITLGGRDYAFDAEVEDKIANGGKITNARFCRRFEVLTSYHDYDIQGSKTYFGGFHLVDGEKNRESEESSIRLPELESPVVLLDAGGVTVTATGFTADEYSPVILNLHYVNSGDRPVYVVCDSFIINGFYAGGFDRKLQPDSEVDERLSIYDASLALPGVRYVGELQVRLCLYSEEYDCICTGDAVVIPTTDYDNDWDWEPNSEAIFADESVSMHLVNITWNDIWKRIEYYILLNNHTDRCMYVSFDHMLVNGTEYNPWFDEVVLPGTRTVRALEIRDSALGEADNGGWVNLEFDISVRDDETLEIITGTQCNLLLPIPAD